MKLEQNEKPLHAGEGHSLEKVYALGCKAHFDGRVDEGNAYFRQLRPEHGELYILAYGFLSQLLSFSRNYDEALKIANQVAEYCPGDYQAVHYLELVHCYRQEYDLAWQLHRSIAPNEKQKESHQYQSACLLSALGHFPEAMIQLERSLSGKELRYLSKAWDDPELAMLWKALPAIALDPNISELLKRPFWESLLNSYDPNKPFVQLDPGNLNSFSSDEMNLVGVIPHGPSARIVVELASENPLIFAGLMDRLMSQRAGAWGALKIALSLVRSDAWSSVGGNN